MPTTNYDHIADYIRESDLPRKQQKLAGLATCRHRRIPMRLLPDGTGDSMILVDGIASILRNLKTAIGSNPSQRRSTMSTYYVATRARYVLVEAADETEARVKGQAALEELVPGRMIEIHTLRLATPDEIELMRWHNEMVASHAGSVEGRRT